MTTRRQHYLPVCYLKGFCRRKKKKYWLVEWDLLEGVSRPSDPRNVAFKKDLYMLPTARSNALETALGQIEGDACGVISAAARDLVLPSGEARQKLLLFVALLVVRVPAIRDAIDRFNVEIAHKHLRMRLRTPETWRAAVEEYRKAGIDPGSQTYEEMVALIDKPTLPIKTNPEWITHLTFEGVLQLLPLLARRRWSLLTVSDGGSEFVTCDNPVALTWTRVRQKSFYPPGFGVSGTDVFVPLTRHVGMLGRFEGGEGVGEASDVAALNNRLLSQAFRYAYSSQSTFSWLQSDMTIGTPEQLMSDPKRPQRRTKKS